MLGLISINFKGPSWGAYHFIHIIYLCFGGFFRLWGFRERTWHQGGSSEVVRNRPVVCVTFLRQLLSFSFPDITGRPDVWATMQITWLIWFSHCHLTYGNYNKTAGPKWRKQQHGHISLLCHAVYCIFWLKVSNVDLKKHVFLLLCFCDAQGSGTGAAPTSCS